MKVKSGLIASSILTSRFIKSLCIIAVAVNSNPPAHASNIDNSSSRRQAPSLIDVPENAADPAMAGVIEQIESGQLVDALDRLQQMRQTESCVYYRGLCYMRLKQFDEALKQFAWLYYYGKNPSIHQKVLEDIRKIDGTRGTSSTSARDKVLSHIHMLSAKPGSKKTPSDSAMEFFAILRTCFGQWDLNRDGVLTGDEIGSLVQNQAIEDLRESAALAALKTQERFDFRSQGQFSPFTLEEIASLQEGVATGNKESTDLVKFYKLGLEKLSNQSMRLFASEVPHITGIKQGHTSDCYFLSVVGSMVTLNPGAVKRMIADNGDGSYSVLFHQAQPIRVNKPTLAEIATYADSGGDGFWLTVLEKAYGVLKETTGAQQSSLVEPLDAVTLHGGKMGPIFLALTGREGKYYRFSNEQNRQMSRQLLLEAKERRRMVCTDVPGHCLSVIGYQSDSDQVQIWNPWGSSRYYEEVGVMMQDGMFSLQVDDFLQKFVGVQIEQ